MEDALAPCKYKFQINMMGVLILVLMEDALARMYESRNNIATTES